jgi:3-methylcrotonyl-CoA carboxylase alpha subunit
MFKKVLIANRGEIAVRIARTCERLGVATVAVYSDVDKEAMHATSCDEAVHIGGNRVQESYLMIEAIIAAAKQTGADAVHPGYGLLSESPAFARAVEAAGLVFIGPSAEMLDLYGDKLRARELARQAGVRVVPGSGAAISNVDELRATADEIGHALMIKAAAGGGGVGMLRVSEDDDWAEALRACADRAREAFGDDRLYVEAEVSRPRHLEVQILADGVGGLVALGELECSMQRRHQNILEESPSPAFHGMLHGDLKREILSDAALRIAREGGYRGAGTAEFLLDSEGRLHFLEFNPRLQVEHVVTEMCTGLDLVEQQLLIASGQPLSSEARQCQPSGHAIEARVYAEDPLRNFMPRPGKVEQLRWPSVAPGRLRIETALAPGSEVTEYYDPMVAKVIAHGAIRHQALLMLDRVLAESLIAPLTTNLSFLREVLAHESFRAGQYDTSFVSRLLAERPTTPAVPASA